MTAFRVGLGRNFSPGVNTSNNGANQGRGEDNTTGGVCLCVNTIEIKFAESKVDIWCGGELTFFPQRDKSRDSNVLTSFKPLSRKDVNYRRMVSTCSI